MRKREPACVVFDFDGTLIPKEAEALVHIVEMEALPPSARPDLEKLWKTYRDRAESGTLGAKGDRKWMVESLDLFIRHGLTFGDALRVLSKVPLRPGAKETLKELRRNGIEAAVVSYGVRQFIYYVLELNGALMYVDEVYAADLIDNPLGGRLKVTRYDPDSIVIPATKGLWAGRFAEKHGVRAGRIFAVGDSGGDKKLGRYKKNRLGVARDEEEARRIAPYFGETVVTEHFGPVRDWLFRKIGLME